MLPQTRLSHVRAAVPGSRCASSSRTSGAPARMAIAPRRPVRGLSPWSAVVRLRCCTLLLYVRLPHAEGAKMAEALPSGYQPQTICVPGGRNLGYCLYGPGDGIPVVFFYGTPGTMFLAPDRLVPVDELGIRLLVADRPGYGASTRLPGRRIASDPKSTRLNSSHLSTSYAVFCLTKQTS